MMQRYGVKVQRGMQEGKQFAGAKVANIDLWEMCEDGKTLMVMVVLEDGRMACYSFCPGAPITAGIVEGA